MPLLRREASEPTGPSCEAFAFFAGVLALCAALGQKVFYKVDGPDLVYLLHQHVAHGQPLHHPWHVGYLPALDLFRRFLALFGAGGDLLRVGELFSAAGVAAGVAFFRAGLRRLGIEGGEARAAALLLALNPGVLFFGSVVEMHGPALGAVGVAFWWMCRSAAAPRAWRMALLGLLTHGAFLMHATNLFLPLLLLPWFVVLRRGTGSARKDLALALLAVAVHAALFVAMPRVFPSFYGDYADLSAAFARESSIQRPQGLEWMPAIFGQEWLLPLLPLSVLVVPAAFRSELRAESLVLALGLLPYLYLATRQLVFEPERGAYLLPLLLPAARICSAFWIGKRGLSVLVVLSMLGGILQILIHERGLAGAYREFANGVAKAARGASRPPFVLIGARKLPGEDGPHDELAMAFASLDPSTFLWVRSQAQMPRERFDPAQAAATVAWLGGILDQGRPVLVTEGAMAELATPSEVLRGEKDTGQPSNDHYAGPLFLDALRKSFRFARAAERPLAGGTRTTSVWRLERR
ncbi:MAG: hypothetical protein Fur0037_12000 [Planctomycetota bacterium]